MEFSSSAKEESTTVCHSPSQYGLTLTGPIVPSAAVAAAHTNKAPSNETFNSVLNSQVVHNLFVPPIDRNVINNDDMVIYKEICLPFQNNNGMDAAEPTTSQPNINKREQLIRSRVSFSPTNRLIAEIKLMNLMTKHKSPLNTFKSIFHWANKCQNIHGVDFSSTFPRHHREAIFSEIKDQKAQRAYLVTTGLLPNARTAGPNAELQQEQIRQTDNPDYHLAYYVVRFHPITRDLSADCLTEQLDVDLLGRNKAYATIFSYFTLASPPQVLLEHLLNLFEAEAVGALGIFYPGPLAQHSPNKNKAFGYLDDIEGEAGELVLVDSAMLSPTIASRVLTLDHHLAELEAHPGRLSIPGIPEGTGHSELIRAHKAFFIPFDQAMEVLHPQLNRVGLMESCTPLFNTLRLAGTTATEPGGNPKLHQPGPSFRSETGLTNYVKHKVMYRDLPELERPWDTPGDPALTAAKSQSVRTTWGPLYTQPSLLLCGKQEEANLPPIYQAWAQKSKHERTHMIFQSQVAARASELGIQAPLITTAALKRFQDGNFHGTDPFDVADGILPMAFTPPGGSVATLKREQEAAATKTKAYIPVDWTEATTQLESYLAVLATILGLNHDAVTSYQQGLYRLKIQQMPLRRAIADEVGEFLTPAIVVYYFQIRVRGWLEEQWEAASTLPSPDFGVDFHTFRMTQNLNWLPNVSNAGAKGSSHSTNSTSPSSSMGVRNLTGGTQQTRLTNPHRDSRLQDSNHPIVKKLESAKIREAIQAMRDKGKGPLSRPDGQERCHSWHIKGACFSSCKHIYDHVAITPTKQDQLWQCNNPSSNHKSNPHLRITHELGSTGSTEAPTIPLGEAPTIPLGIAPTPSSRPRSESLVPATVPTASTLPVEGPPEAPASPSPSSTSSSTLPRSDLLVAATLLSLPRPELLVPTTPLPRPEILVPTTLPRPDPLVTPTALHRPPPATTSDPPPCY
eukprot:jgi/Psemu1/40914/gm1.40914_g